ncbi:ATP synthase F1, delta subunit [Candidatus Saccharibacteria bacterium RAAC3_TM7_1]|nr:ATP synthase F1, delta subunit [Candidatus Saccharibacteria bacterium RAAC3_TM7_1]HCZ28603.1 hypothetical protein [Candidatus Saccharibacteria bacterium]
MAGAISRRKLSQYVADRLAEGESNGMVLRELAAYLIETHRQREAELIIRDVETALLARGMAAATVTSARPLSEDAKKSLETFIKSQYEGIERVALKEQIDTSLIGGMRLKLPDKQLDASVKTRLEKLGA